MKTGQILSPGFKEKNKDKLTHIRGEEQEHASDHSTINHKLFRYNSSRHLHQMTPSGLTLEDTTAINMGHVVVGLAKSRYP